jgi:hypothetical protein
MKNMSSMRFLTEEDLDVWFAAEKERLSDELLNNLDRDKENTPKHKAWFDAEMKKLLAKYTAEYEKFLHKKSTKTTEE